MSASWSLVFAAFVLAFIIDRAIPQLTRAIASLKCTDDDATNNDSSVRDRLAVAQISATLIAQHGTISQGGYISLTDRKRFIELACDIYTDAGWAQKERMRLGLC